MSAPLDFREEWVGLLRRRLALAPLLRVYGAVLEAWAGWSRAGVTPLGWGAAQCAARWERGVPLLADAPPPCAASDLEPLLGAVMDALAAVGAASTTGLQRFAEAWDRGEIGLDALLPRPGSSGSPGEAVSRLLAVGSLRPVLDAYFADTRLHPAEAWTLGVCPYCGAPPVWAELLEGGQRRLACHLCGAGWRFPRLACPYCGSAEAKDAVRLHAEGGDEGYGVAACARCRGYLKEVDRRVRWNVGSALLEDWASPHLDLVAGRRGYWRGLPPLIELGLLVP